MKIRDRPDFRDTAGMQTRPMEERCKLHRALGEDRACAHESCGLWEDGGEALDGGCAVAHLGLDLSGRPDLAAWLIGLRRNLERARDASA